MPKKANVKPQRIQKVRREAPTTAKHDYLLDAVNGSLLDLFPAAAEAFNLVLGVALLLHVVAGLAGFFELRLVFGAQAVEVLKKEEKWLFTSKRGMKFSH